jgi:hypothetical protein
VPEGAKPFTVAPAKAEAAVESAPLDRIKAKIAELNALSAQIADQQSAEGQAFDAALTAREMPAEPMALSAMREAEDEITPPAEIIPGSADSRIDADPPEDPSPEPEPEKRVTLAERFRALRDGVGS